MEFEPRSQESSYEQEDSPSKKQKLDENKDDIKDTISNELSKSLSTTSQTEDNITEDQPKMIWKLQLSNLPRYLDPSAMKKQLVKWSIDMTTCKVKKGPQWTYGFLTFQNEEQMKTAEAKILGQKIKNNVVEVKQYLQTEEQNRNHYVNKNKGEKEKIDLRTPAEKLASQITPLHHLTYAEQLAHKQENITKILRKFLREMRNIEPGFVNRVTDHTILANETPQYNTNNLPCRLDPVIPSPIVNGYRSKCEFTIGRNFENEPEVGFLLGNFKDGITAVLDPAESLNIPDIAKKLARVFRDYIRSSEWQVYDRTNKTGNWRGMLTRTQTTGEVMVLVQFHPQGMAPEQITVEKERLGKYFGELKNLTGDERIEITTLLVQIYDGLSNGISSNTPTDLIFGPGYIHERILDCTFRISPHAFLQVNTPATEILYSTVRDWCNVDSSKKTTLLDLCCGTGTIGITMAKSVSKVVGVEMVEQAIVDAKDNAARNEVTNANFICAKVESALYVLSGFDADEEVVAVLDPPRAGMHTKVITTIRNTEAIKRIIYVSCDANQAMNNFIALCRPSSNKYTGNPFRPKRAVPVDLFPHTDHCELVIEFSRE